MRSSPGHRGDEGCPSGGGLANLFRLRDELLRPRMSVEICPRSPQGPVGEFRSAWRPGGLARVARSLPLVATGGRQPETGIGTSAGFCRAVRRSINSRVRTIPFIALALD